MRKFKYFILIFLSFLSWVSATAQSGTNSARSSLFVHDPVMIKEGDTYYVFGTGKGIGIKTSKDRVNWSRAGRVFNDSLVWWKTDIPDQKGDLWAPDIHFRDGRYHLYYSVSAWMNFNSSIGYATNVTLNPADPRYKWEDQGMIINFKNGGEGVNCIDPNVFVDDDGRIWLFYGSYKAGLRLTELDPKSGRLMTNPPFLTVITNALGEGVFVVKSRGYYYIFASRGRCCAGLESTYQIVIGRSKNVKGPYLTKTGESWVDSKYTLFLAGDFEEPGRGHNGFITDRDTTFMVYHAYTRSANGASLLNIKPMFWGSDGWPTLERTNDVFVDGEK
jgi:arabinan endo-1,5-alpha-L-arabinosidase